MKQKKGVLTYLAMNRKANLQPRYTTSRDRPDELSVQEGEQLRTLRKREKSGGNVGMRMAMKESCLHRTSR